jgi:pyruvate carboxylase
MMVSQGLSAADVLDPKRDVAFPASAVAMLHGEYGQPLGGWPEALQRKALKGEPPITVRYGSLIPDANLEAERAEVSKLVGHTAGDKELASYLMYPKVFSDFAPVVAKFGPVSTLPTPVFFYGMKPGDEITIEIERGKTLLVRLTALGETRDDGLVEVFFELNGQPRMIVTADRAAVPKVAGRPKAELGNDLHVAAPMPGTVSSLAVHTGQEVKAGDVLLTIEAMKMETALHAPRAGTVAEILVSPGNSIDAKDLLVVLEE